jgi:hypothetical protein
LDGTTFIDSGYNTTLNASSQIKSQRQTPLSHLHESYQNNQPIINDPILSSAIRHHDANNINQTNPYNRTIHNSNSSRQYPNLNVDDNRNYVPTSISSPTLYTSSGIPNYNLSNKIPEQTIYNSPLNVIDQNRINGVPSHYTTSKNYKSQQKQHLLQQQRYKQNQSNIINDNQIEYIQTQVPFQAAK